MNLGRVYFLGVPGGNRTPDQWIRSPLLYPLSYWDTGLPLSKQKKYGAGEGNRTLVISLEG